MGSAREEEGGKCHRKKKKDSSAKGLGSSVWGQAAILKKRDLSRLKGGEEVHRVDEWESVLGREKSQSRGSGVGVSQQVGEQQAGR